MQVSTQCPAPSPFLWSTVDHPYLFRVLYGFMFIPTQPSFPGPWVFFIKTNAALVHNSCDLQGFFSFYKAPASLGLPVSRHSSCLKFSMPFKQPCKRCSESQNHSPIFLCKSRCKTTVPFELVLKEKEGYLLTKLYYELQLGSQLIPS